MHATCKASPSILLRFQSVKSPTSGKFRLPVQGVDFQPVQIDLSQKPSYFTRSTSGLVPAVALRGDVITESLDICRWVDKTFDGPALIPEDQRAKDVMESLISSASRINSAGLDLLAGRTGR